MHFIRAFVSWVVDQLIDRWPTVAILVGGAVMTYLASISKWLDGYGPVAWASAGVVGVLAMMLIYVAWQFGVSLRIRNRFNSLAIEKGHAINPLDNAFTRKRIYVNDLVLPSLPLVQGKTFDECDVIGPANVVFTNTVQTTGTRLPRIDAVWLSPNYNPNLANLIIFDNCTFRNCSFQRVTLFYDIRRFRELAQINAFNWVSVSPSEEQVNAAINPPIKAVDG